MSDKDILVRVEHVSKKFCRSLKKSLWYGVQDICADLNPFRKNELMVDSSFLRDEKKVLASPPASQLSTHDSQLHTDGQGEVSNPNSQLLTSNSSLLRGGEFWAVNDVSFELRRGECLGLIGHNGAGKTTLLKMLNGLVKPDSGRIEMRGRVGALIALGAGFNPILTGRENIYVNGSVLGLTKREIDAKLEDVIDFADIREFIDSPVQSYSSGMQVRLGFAVATAMEPDVLILDEVLAVGDANFRTKCFVRISSLLSKAAVIFVSHSEEQLSRICTSGLLLEQGKVARIGGLRECLTDYRERRPLYASELVSYQDESIQQAEIKLCATEHISGEDLPLEIHYTTTCPAQLSLHVLALIDETGMAVAVCDLLPLFRNLASGTNVQKCVVKALSLRPGLYTFGLEALSVNHGTVIARKHFQNRLRFKNSISYWCSYTPQVSKLVLGQLL